MHASSRLVSIRSMMLLLLLTVTHTLADNVSPSPNEYAAYARGSVAMNGRSIVTGHLGAGGALSLQDDCQISEGVYSAGAMSLRYRIRVDGLVHSDSTLEIYEDSILRDSVQSAGSMTLRYRVHVDGDATSAGSINSMSGVTIDGSTSQYSALPHTWTAPTLTAPTFSPGSSDINVGAGLTRELDPGAYAELTLQAGARLSLSSGVYHFDALTSQSDVQFVIDDLSGPVQIYVRQGMIVGNRADIVLDSGDGSNLQWFVGGDLTIRTDAQFAGQVQCFSGVTLEDRITTNGSIYAAGAFSCGWDCVLSVAQSKVFFVATNGNDANSGTSMSVPLRTIQAAINKCVEAGSVVYIAPGTYSERLQIGMGSGSAVATGTEEDPIRIIGDVDGTNTNRDPGSVVIDGTGQQQRGIELSDVDHWLFDGLSITGFTQYGVYATDSGFSYENATIEVPSYYAFYAVVDEDTRIEGCRFDRDPDSSGHIAWIMPSTGAPGVDIAFIGNDASLRDDLYLSKKYQDGYGSTNTTNSGSGERTSSQYGVVLYGYQMPFGNVEVSNNQFSDLYLPMLIYSKNSSSPTVVANNTLVGCLMSIYCYAYQGSGTVYVHNNIISRCYYGAMTSVSQGPKLSVSGLLEHRITYNMSSYARPYEFDVLTDDPLFYEPASGDFSLYSLSVAVDAGSSLYAPSTDINGLKRPTDGNGDGVGQVDLGAYEETHEGRPYVRVINWREIGGDNNR